jgi:transposase
MAKKKARYTKRPSIPDELAARVTAVEAVLGGRETVTGAATLVGVSRVRMQSIVHRAEEALVSSLAPRPPGPPPQKTDRERQLEEENERLKERLARAEHRAAMLQRFTETAGDLIRASSTRRGRRSRSSRDPEKPAAAAKDPDPDPTREHALAAVEELRGSGMTADASARAIGSGPSTVRKWRRRARAGALPRQPRVRRASRSLPCAIASRAEAIVRATHGRVGADALRHAVDCALSRREAARLKSSVRTSMERERQARCEHVEVVTPGAVRGFDGVHLSVAEGVRWLLTSADAAVPYRTSHALVERYDGAAVLAAIEADFDEHGAPLVWRVDRAKAHTTPALLARLASRGVLVLHGPPRLPRFYGQLERQNRDDRALLAGLGQRPLAADVAAYLPDLRRIANTVWPRRALGFRTPEAVWTTRPELRDNRLRLHIEVQQRAARYAADLRGAPAAADLAMRRAIEDALEERGHLRRTTERALIDVRC